MADRSDNGSNSSIDDEVDGLVTKLRKAFESQPQEVQTWLGPTKPSTLEKFN